jgi:hypothetical protein
VELLISLGLGMAMYELYAWLPVISRWLLGLAVRRLPPAKQERYREEWTAHLEDLPTSMAQVLHAIGCNFTSIRFRAEGLKARYAEIGASLPELEDSHRRILRGLKELQEARLSRQCSLDAFRSLSTEHLQALTVRATGERAMKFGKRQSKRSKDLQK